MTTLTAAQIAQVAANAGFTGTGLVRAVACALAESSGNPNATNRNSDGSVDRGLWQINNHWHSEVSDAEAFNPATAAAAAYRISKAGADWREWATWSDGAMAAQMGRAQLAAASVKGGGTTANPALYIPGVGNLPSPGDIVGGIVGGVTGAAGDVANATGLSGLAKIAEAVVHAGAWMSNPHNWLRVLEVVAGAGVVILGVKLLADTGVGGPVGAAARGASKAGGAYVGHIKKAKSLATTAATGGTSAAAKGAAGAANTAAKGAAA